MGSRWRLKASTDENVRHANDNNGKPYPPELKRLIRALKTYGMILADNGIADPHHHRCGRALGNFRFDQQPGICFQWLDALPDGPRF